MSDVVRPPSPEPLVDGELIDDRSVEAIQDDNFGHSDFVRELTGIVRRVQTPANIALFGAWGSGKSGIANLLKLEIEKMDDRVARFVVFDASKYAETPLRRHFIYQVADALDVDDEQFRDGLYVNHDSNSVRFTVHNWAALAKWFASLAVVFLTTALAIAGIVAAVEGHAFQKIALGAAPLLVPTAAIASVMIRIAFDGFTIKTTRVAPKGDEEFQQRFEALVKAAKTERLVIFVDELDRCSPSQIASALETLKTFLFVTGCVFVVGADQQVLEQALHREVRQHTPEDPTNPYYSAGSSYLDKVFQYQLGLPPIKPTTLTRFALSLTATLPGVWARIPDRREVISVLIPTHVTSPRRVKVLLNRFAVTYRLVESRGAEGRLGPDVGPRASELAKLVCLQCEFPLFAEDLTLDPRLPELVRAVADGEELPDSVRPDVKAKAEAYATGRRQVAELLVDTYSEVKADVEASTERRDVDEQLAAGEISSSRGKAVAHSHTQQLVNYLRKTRMVAGPGPDLLFLESAGADHNVDAIRAEALQLAARDRDLREVLRLVDDLRGDGDNTVGALLVLSDVVRQAHPGVEGRNSITALLQAIDQSGVDLTANIANEILDAAGGEITRTPLDARDILGAVALLEVSTRDVGREMLLAVLQYPATTTDAQTAARLIALAGKVPDSVRGQFAKAAAVGMLRSPETAVRSISRVSRDDLLALVVDGSENLDALSNSHYAAVTRRDLGEDFDEDALLELDPAVALGEIFDDLPEPDSERRSLILLLMLRMAHADFRAEVAERTGKVAPVQSSELTAAMLTSAEDLELADWSAWIGSLEPAQAAAAGLSGSELATLRYALWAKCVEEPNGIHAEAAIRELGRVAGDLFHDQRAANGMVAGLGSPLTSDDAIKKQRNALDLLQTFAAARLLSDAAAESAWVSSVCSALATELETDDESDPYDAVLEEILDRLRIADASWLCGGSERILETAAESPWLTANSLTLIRLLVTASEANEMQGASQSPVSVDEIVSLAPSARFSQSSREVVGLWLTYFADSADDVWRVLTPLVDRPLPNTVGDALGIFLDRSSADDQVGFVDRALDAALTSKVSTSVLRSARMSEAPESHLAAKLVELYEGCGNLSERKRVVALWAVAPPSRPAVRKELTQRLFIPFVGTGSGALDAGLSNFNLVAEVKDIRGDVTVALRTAAKSEAQKKRVERCLAKAGWNHRATFLRRLSGR